MTKDDVRRMMSLVDEQYIGEITQETPDIPEEFEAAEIEHITVQEAPRQGWRIWAALAAAVVLCVPVGYGLAHGFGMLPEEQLHVGTSAETDWAAFVDSMSDEEIDSYFSTDFPETDPARDIGFTVSYGGRMDAVPFATEYAQKFLWFDTQDDSVHIANVVVTEDETGLTLSGERYLEIAVMNTGQYGQDIMEMHEPVYLPQFENVAFYGFYMEWENAYSDGAMGLCLFRYENVDYQINCKGFTKRELLTLVYEVLDSGATPESLNELYQRELAEQNRMQAELEEARRREADYARAMELLAEVNAMDFCEGWVPMLPEIGSMTLGGYGTVDGMEKVKLSYGSGESTENGELPCLYLTFYSGSYGERADFAAAPITPENWSAETVNTAPYCTSRPELNWYQFMLDLGDCMMAVDASCTPEDMAVLVDAMSDIIAEKTGTQTDESTWKTTAEAQLAGLNAAGICAGWVPQLTEIGRLRYKELQSPEESVSGHGFVSYTKTLSQGKGTDFLIVSYFPEGSELAVNPQYPMMQADQWSMETLSSVAYCTVLDDGMYQYRCTVDLGGLYLGIDAECSAEEMEIYVNAMSDLMAQNYGTEEASAEGTNWFYKNSMDALKALSFGGWIPELETIGKMQFSNNGNDAMQDTDRYAVITWTADKNSTAYALTASWYSKEFARMDLSYPEISADDWSMETLSSPTYCTDTESVYRDTESSVRHLPLYQYQFAVDWGECVMVVDAMCPQEDMEIFVQAMADIYAGQQ